MDVFSPALNGMPLAMCKSMTHDQGWEMPRYAEITQKTGWGEIFILESDSPLQRVSNNNINGLIRQYPCFCFGASAGHVRRYQVQLEVCDQQIAQSLLRLSQQKSPPSEPLPKPRHRTRQPNALNFDVRSLFYQSVGIDLTQTHGIGPYLALRLVAQCGTDLSRWRTAHHFTSWLTLAPGCRISGGKVLSAHTRKTKNRVTAHLRFAAVTIGRMNTELGAFYRRLSARIGKAKEVTATARKMAILFYNAMHFGMAYQDPGGAHYEQKYRERVVKGLHRRAAEFGFTLEAVEGVS